MAETMKEWALYYASMGLAVFPLVPEGKRPATANGCKAATVDTGQIESWWEKSPSYNIGIATGDASGGLVAIDLDVDEGKGVDGRGLLESWQKNNGELPKTWTSVTGRGGHHLLYRSTFPCQNRVKLYAGVDVRGNGGYIVAPPSLHPNGRRYAWKHGPGEITIAQADNRVISFLMGPAAEKQLFQEPETIPEGERTDTMVRLVGSLRAKGLDDEAVKAAVRVENGRKCVPPLTDQELEKTVFPALNRGWKTEKPYAADAKGAFRQRKDFSLDVVTMDRAEEKTPEWLITDYMPRYQITSLAGDGGSGKTTVWCALAAAVSSGKRSFIETDWVTPFSRNEPGLVMFFSAEDSFEYTLKRRLRKNGANLANIVSIDIADERFQEIKFNSGFLEQLLEKHRPVLCIFDPIQAFVPPDIRMGDRNAMRSCLAPLVGYGEKYGTTFLIIEHANKQSNVWGRKRIADSADIWDISRSVIMAGETTEKGIRYLSHEKSNYGMTAGTVLYSIVDEVVEFKSHSNKKDKDFVTEADYTTRLAPQREEAKEFILDFLKDGEKEVAELDELASAMSISKSTLKRAKADLKREGKTKTWSIGYGQDKKFFIRLSEDSLTDTENVN